MRRLTLACVLLAGCGGNPRPSREPPLISPTYSETTPSEPDPPAPRPEWCSEPWPDDPDDPRVGFYSSRGRPSRPAGARREPLYVVYDGHTVVLSWEAGYPGCGRRGPRMGGLVRLAARVRGDTLQARALCAGWVDVARFEESGRAVLQLADEPIDLYPITEAMIEPCDRERWLLCSPTFETPPAGPFPDPPEEYVRPPRPPPGMERLPPLSECSLGWEPTPANHHGLYATDPFDGYPDRSEPIQLRTVVFDGTTVTLLYDPAARARRACSDGSASDRRRGIHRFAASVSDGRVLEARLPCEGWTPIGVFEDGALRLDGVHEPLWLSDLAGRCATLPYLACRPVSGE